MLPAGKNGQGFRGEELLQGQRSGAAPETIQRQSHHGAHVSYHCCSEARAAVVHKGSSLNGVFRRDVPKYPNLHGRCLGNGGDSSRWTRGRENSSRHPHVRKEKPSPSGRAVLPARKADAPLHGCRQR
ncbi:unnamed protein product, partial [Ectocarpus sp. 12 AP-2014]